MGQKENSQGITLPQIAGIKTVLPDYSVAWQINKGFQVNFCMSLDWKKKNQKNEDSLHRHFFCHFEDVELDWHLIQNKGSAGYFFQSKPLFDYLLICNGDDIYNYFGLAIQKIKNESQVEHIFPFNFELLPSKEPFFSNLIKSKYFIEDLNV